ncbi:MAG: hypothetical protein KGL39_52495 [Patescibacteria group bacterium]|nr:hypothetical protein [Patescibacteria group bacterium]
MGQTATNISQPMREYNGELGPVETAFLIGRLRRRNRSLRRIALFQAFALVLAAGALVTFSDWRITVGWYAIALCYLPFFARR